MSGETSPASYVVALIQGRGYDVGIAALDKNTATMTLTQVSDCATYIKTLHHVHLHAPLSILIPDNYLSNDPKTATSSISPFHTFLIRSLHAEFPDARFECVHRKHWNSELGLERITELCVKGENRTGLLVVIRDKYYALCSAAALLKFLGQDMNIAFAKNSLRLLYTTVEGSLFIDSATAKSLELIENMSTKNAKQTLFRLLNHTFTDMGSRLLRNNLLAPSKMQATIEARHDAVDEIIHDEEMYNGVRESFKPLRKTDFDKTLSLIVTSQLEGTAANIRLACFSNRVAQMLKIRDFLRCLPAVQLAISTSSSSLIKLLYKILNDQRFVVLQNMVSQTFNDDLPLYKKNNKTSLHIYVYAVKASVNRLLDVARETFRENLSDIYQLCQDLSEKYELPIQLNHNSSGHYCFMLKKHMLPSPFPKEFIHVTTKGTKVTFFTMELKKKNARVKDALDEIMILSDRVVEDLLDEVLEGIGILYKASEAIALLDLLWSFAHTSIVHNYVRPEFTGVIAIKGGRHPILDADSTLKGALVPNDTYCCCSTYFQLIQGANMSGSTGKTTYVKQVALLVILAMCGCFVPAEYASFKLHDALFARFSGDDSSVDYSLSTFGSEMASIATILGLSTSRSLIFLDEIGRGTSISEGLGISLAIAERLLSEKIMILAGSMTSLRHFEEFPKLLNREPAVVWKVSIELIVSMFSTFLCSLYLLTQKSKKNLTSDFHFKYKIVDGSPDSLGHYGIDLATLADMPLSMFQHARKATERLFILNQEQEQNSTLRGITERRKALIQLRSRLQRVRRFSTLGQKDLLGFLQKIQADVITTLGSQL